MNTEIKNSILLVPKSKISEMLTKQIERGKNQILNNIDYGNDFGVAKKHYYRWNDFNKELLKRYFNSHEYKLEYEDRKIFNEYPDLIESLAKKQLKECFESKIECLESIYERLELLPEASIETRTSNLPSTSKINKNKIFIVHGHDEAVKHEVARFISDLGFSPVILSEQASESKTIIEKIEAHSDVGFGVVLYTPCDVGAEQAKKETLNNRARQNVVFEHGFLIGKLTRSNVCALVKGDIEKPNDISGIVYTSMDTSNWKLELAKELRAAGYPVDMNKVI